MATFEKRANGSWRAKVYAGRDANGKVLYKSITKQSLKECKKAARQLEQEIADNRFVDVGRTRLIAWCEKWLELNEGRLSPATVVSYQIYIDKHYKPYFKNLRLSQVNEIHCRGFMSAQLKSGLSPTTVKKHMIVLSEILQVALKDKNPCSDIKLPEVAGFIPEHVDTELFEEIRAVMRKTKNPLRNDLIVCLAGWMGFRRGEIFALMPDDIDYINKRIRIDEGRVLGKDGYISKSPKSKNGLRCEAAPDELLAMIKEYRASAGVLQNSRLFPNRPDNWSSWFRQTLDAAGLPPVRFHDLRHYHTNWMYEAGIPDQFAAKRAGHDIQTLKKIYQHLGLKQEEALDEAVRRAPQGQARPKMGDKMGDKKIR